MGTISSGIGLISGLDIQELVGKLIDLESGASKQLQTQIDRNTEIQTLLGQFSLRIAGFNLAATRLGKGQSFTERTASSSNPAIVATAGKGATLGSFSFTPRRLAATHQTLSSGYSSSSASIASTAATVTISQGGFVDESTRLSLLNGGSGVRSGSIRLVDASGGSAIVELSGAVSVRDVVDAINAASGINVSATTRDDRLEIVDQSGGAGVLQVQEVAGGSSAADLGLLGLAQSGNTYTGTGIFSLGEAISLESVRDGNGIRSVAGNDFSITAGSVSLNVDVSDATSIGDVVDLINENVGNTGGKIQASLSGGRIVLTDTLATDAITVATIGGSAAAGDLGILGVGAGGTLTGQDILGDLDTVLLTTLRGGSTTLSPVAGSIDINGTVVDLTAATTLQDVVDTINGAAIAGVNASINAAGNGLQIQRTGGSLTISDVSGNLAEFLNIDGSDPGTNGIIQSGGLDRQYVNDNSRLSSYGAATGVPKGKFRITDGNGDSAIVDLTQEADDTIGDVIREINTRGLAVAARVNDTGDGIFIENTAGTGTVLIQEVSGGSTAKALRLLNEPDVDGNVDGRLAVSIAVDAGMTLSEFADAVKESGAPAQASILNDGSATSPFRLSLTSTRTGASGRLLIDAGATNLSFTTISRAQDAVLLFGSGASPLQIVSSSNTFSDLVPGLSLSATQTSTSPVTVSVSKNEESVVDAAKAFVEEYNALRDFLDENARFDPETEEKGPLFTDPSTRRIERQLATFATRLFADTGGEIQTLGEVGIRLNSEGKLDFDESLFRGELASRPDDVEQFFSATNGVVSQLQSLTDALTGAADGALTLRVEQISRTIDRQNATLEAQFERLEAKEAILYQQFYAMESALAAFQSQQTSLNQLASLAASFSSR